MNAVTAIRPVAADTLAPLRAFVLGLGAVLARPRRPDWRDAAAALLADLVGEDAWLPESHAAADADRYRQYLLHRDPAGRFSVVSFVWGPGQTTPIHDHTVWGMVGMLRGAELVEGFRRTAEGLVSNGTTRLDTGAIDVFAPETGDIHRVANAFDDRISISIHVYGADIGTVRRSTFADDGTARPFVSGYADAPSLPLWSGGAA